MNTKHSTRRLDNLRFRSIRRDVTRDIKAINRLRLPWWGRLCVIAGTVCIGLLFYQFGRLNMALPSLSVVGALASILVVKWQLRQQAWFWITLAIMAALHVLLLLVVPWTNKWVPAVVSAGIVSVDLYLMFWILAAVQNLVERRKAAEG